jgi:phosphoglycerate kinase
MRSMMGAPTTGLWPVTNRLETPGFDQLSKLRPLVEHWEDVVGKRVLLRVDLNIELNTGVDGVSYRRIQQTIPLLRELIKRRCRVVMISHLGRPNGRPQEALSLAPVADLLADYLAMDVVFLPWPAEQDRTITRFVNRSPPGTVLLLENLRFHPGELSAAPDFAANLAQLGDCYVNDAFSVSHRAHSSVVVLPTLLPSYVGPLFLEEYRIVEALSKHIQRPFVVVAGGGKTEKLEWYASMLPLIDRLVVGSGLAAAAARIDWLVEAGTKPSARVVLPTDFAVRCPDGSVRIVAADALEAGMLAVDIGPATSARYQAEIRRARTLLCNGGLGVLEPSHPASSYESILSAYRGSRALKVICGGTGASIYGDDAAATHPDYVLTAGGATLALLANRTSLRWAVVGRHGGGWHDRIRGMAGIPPLGA